MGNIVYKVVCEGIFGIGGVENFCQWQCWCKEDFFVFKEQSIMFFFFNYEVFRLYVVDYFCCFYQGVFF